METDVKQVSYYMQSCLKERHLVVLQLFFKFSETENFIEFSSIFFWSHRVICQLSHALLTSETVDIKIHNFFHYRYHISLLHSLNVDLNKRQSVLQWSERKLANIVSFHLTTFSSFTKKCCYIVLVHFGINTEPRSTIFNFTFLLHCYVKQPVKK